MFISCIITNIIVIILFVTIYMKYLNGEYYVEVKDHRYIYINQLKI